MDVPFSYLRATLKGSRKREDREVLTSISEERDRIVAEYRALIKSDDDRKSFEDAYNVVRPFTGMPRITCSGSSTGSTPYGSAK